MTPTQPPQTAAPKGAAFRQRGRRVVAVGATLALTLGMGIAGAQAVGTPAVAAPLQATAAAASAAPIVADGIASGQITSSADVASTTKGKHVIAGHASIAGTGSPATAAGSDNAVPEGTTVYVQWQDTDGSVSPTYSAKTFDALPGQFGGPGAYVFKLPSWTDAFGVTHYFTASSKQQYRLWIEPMTNPRTAGEVTVFRAADGMTPNRFVKVGNGDGALGAVTVAGTNVRSTGLFMYEKPQQYMVSANVVTDDAGPVNHPSVQTDEKHTVSGTVWLETGAGDRSNSGTGPNQNLDLGDRAAEGYTVYVSMLTREGAAANDAIKDLDKRERPAATKQMLLDHPEYLAVTVAAKTDINGNYTARMGEGFFDVDNMYTWVADASGKVISSYSSSTHPVFADYNANLLWTPQTAPAMNPALDNLYNRNHALIPFENATIDVTNFDVTSNAAMPGETAELALQGNLTPLETQVTWRDAEGTTLSTCEGIASAADVAACSFTVPTDLAEDEIYTATLWAADIPVSADSFAAFGNDSNAGASANASASAAAAADGQATAAAQAAATANASTKASAKATANAQAAAKSAATANASANASSKADAAAKASAQAAANSKSDSDSNASGSAKAEGNAAAAAKAAANQNASANASSKASANANGNTNGASAKADVNASASASADSNANAAAKAAAKADASTTASAKATANAQSAAKAAASPNASSKASTKADAASKAAAQAAANHKGDSDSNAKASAKTNSNASSAAKAAAIADASSDASGKNPNPNTVKCQTPSTKSPFLDTAMNHKFFTEIDWMYCMKYTTGIKSDAGLIYGPQLRLSREAMAAFIFRMEADPKYNAPKVSPFADMKPGDKFYREIAWMYEEGLSTGIKQAEGKPFYGPKLRLTREAMAAFIYRLEDPNYTAFPPSKMQDMKPGDKFYTEVSWMVDEGLSTGIRVEGGNREYWPKAKLSREAMAAFIYRLVHEYRA